jgi:putative ABC transport system permease protein
VWSALLSLSVGFSLIAGLQGVQGSLERALTLNDERAPHVFMIDVQEDQRDPLLSDAREVGVEALEALPLIRARVSSLKGERVSRASLQGESVAAKMRARTLTREHNLTTRLELGAAEQVVAGRWWSEGEGLREDARYVSLEERFAGRLGLEVGDQLTFDVQGVPLTLEVLSLRRVDWLSLRPNFLIVVPPGPLEGAPRTYVMAGKLSDERALERLSEVSVARAPNVSVVDMRPLFAEGRRLLAALNTALQLTGGLCALAGALLLILGVRRDHERRAGAARALTSLGLSERRAWRWVSLELSLLGFISAFIISVGALSLTWGATRALQLPLTPDLTRLGFWLALSALLAPLVGSAQALKRGRL